MGIEENVPHSGTQNNEKIKIYGLKINGRDVPYSGTHCYSDIKYYNLNCIVWNVPYLGTHCYNDYIINKICWMDSSLSDITCYKYLI